MANKLGATITINHEDITLNEDIGKILADEIKKEIDDSIMLSMLVSMGWIAVDSKNKNYNEMDAWCKQFTKKFHSLGSTYAFENEKDAVLFALKWADK